MEKNIGSMWVQVGLSGSNETSPFLDEVEDRTLTLPSPQGGCNDDFHGTMIDPAQPRDFWNAAHPGWRRTDVACAAHIGQDTLQLRPRKRVTLSQFSFSELSNYAR
jgi:hypothetical protein